MQTLINKTFLVSASALSVFGLLLVTPGAIAQEMSEEMETIEAVELENTEGDVIESVEMEDSDFDGETAEMEAGDMEGDVVEMDTDDVDSDVDYDDTDVEVETEAAPTYSNSPRALW